MNSLPFSKRQFLWKEPLKQLNASAPLPVCEIFKRKALSKVNSLRIKSSFQSDFKNYSIPSWDDWDKKSDTETVCMPAPISKEFWTSELIPKPLDVEAERTKKFVVPDYDESISDRDTFVIRLTRRKDWIPSTKLQSPVEQTPEGRGSSDNSIVDWICRPSASSVVAPSFSSNGSAGSEKTTLIRKKKVEEEKDYDILEIEVDEGEFLDLPIPFHPIVYSKFIVAKQRKPLQVLQLQPVKRNGQNSRSYQKSRYYPKRHFRR